MTKHFCDICEKEISQTNIHYVEVGKSDDTIKFQMVCRECSNKVKDFVQSLANKDIITDKGKQNAKWLVWSGWKGNHDQRIDDAECSNCGYKHPTVFGSTEKLSKYCLNCKSEMSIKYFG